MSRYDTTYATLAKRAVDSTMVDIEAFIQQLMDRGVSAERIEAMMLHDLEEGGPLFGKFFRNIEGASIAATTVAESSASMVASSYDFNEDLKEFLSVKELDAIYAEANPGTMKQLEDATLDIMYTWVARLVNTCHLCLPLHGKTKALREWNDLGLNPSTIHSNEGWASKCKCSLEPSAITESRKDLVDPLVRNKDATRPKGSKRTVRAITQVDVEKSRKAVASAMESLEGRRMLRLLGKSGEQ